MSKIKTGCSLKKEVSYFKLLMRSIPSTVVALFTVSVVLMNLLANKELTTGTHWLVLDGGITLSWLSFLVMDMVTKRFGPKAAIQLSAFAAAVNLLTCAIFWFVSVIPGNWSAFYTYNAPVINKAMNDTFGGTWYVLLGSMIAFLVSSTVNAVVNAGIGRLVQGSGFSAFAIRSWVSTLFAQFVDNMTFALIVSHVFFGWSMVQCLFCSITGCLVELLCEVVFTPIGYKVSKQWEKDGVGSDYLEEVSK